MDFNLNTDRSSIYQEHTECFKRTRFKHNHGQDDVGSLNDSINVRKKSDSLKGTFSNRNNNNTIEHTKQETKVHAGKAHDALNENINRTDSTITSQHKTFNKYLPKVNRLKEETEFGNGMDTFSFSCSASSDNCADNDLHEGFKEKEGPHTLQNQNKHKEQKTQEVNGCRPKQNILPQNKPQTGKMPFGGKDQKHKSREGLVKRMPKAVLEKDSVAKVIEPTQPLTVLKNCVRRASKDENVLEVLLNYLSKIFTSGLPQRRMISIFDALKESGFFEILEKYLVTMIIKINTGKTQGHTVEPVLRNILCIIVEQLTRNPSSVFIFRKLHALLGQIIDELTISDSVDDKIILRYQHLSEQRKATEKEHRKYPDKIQYPKPKDDFRQYSVSPTADEITSRANPPIRPNKVDEVYEDLDDYLDVHFRLLREDFVAPLREGMTQYIDIMSSNNGNIKTKDTLRNLNIKVYENVRVHSPVVTKQGLCYKLQIKMTTGLRKIEWKFSKRLIYGSMVCLTDMNFNDFFLATVEEREEVDIQRGFFIVHFETNDLTTEDILHKVFTMVETTGYFESYKHVLKSLQAFKDGDLPFEKYIVHCQKKIDPPAYLTRKMMYDLRPLVNQDIESPTSRDLWDDAIEKINEQSEDLSLSTANAAKEVNVLDLKTWPSKELLHMDNSQYKAVQNALSNEFAIIQGPPGTGKTYIGLQIVKALLHNKSAWTGIGKRNSTMLIVCHTNHALDQFLEGIVKFFKGNILRVGSRSNSEILEKFNLKAYRKKDEENGSVLAKLKFKKREARRKMELQSKSVQRLTKTIQVYQMEIVCEEVLSKEMDEKMYVNLTHGYRGADEEEDYSVIVKWLEIEEIEKDCRKEALKEIRQKRTKHIQVEDEASRMQKDRMIDTWEDFHPSAYEHELLQSIREDIAFFVPDTTYFRSQYLKLLKWTIVDKISDEDIMNQEEADNIDDIWRLSQDARWRLYRLWIKKLCTRLFEQIEDERKEFEEAAKRYRKAVEQVDKEIMRKTTVIGMTTSGAARYQSVLREIGPKIIVVEEAAEVLEAHIITTLSKECEHLILIGDHKQLRPNPTVYKLAVKFNLDISLFERMVKNRMKFDCLELQHRMRPEISSIMRYIYPELKDHEHVKSYPNVKGISTNLFLLNHSHLEYSDKDIKSYSNEKEAEYAVALCRYLLLQGYENHEVTVLTTYTGQLKCIQNLMPENEFDGVKVTVVDNYQGEENEIVILSLVRSNMANKIGFLKTENRICVALSRAKVGFFVIGNFDHLAKHSTLWNKITNTMKKRNCFGEGLKLYCQNHPNDNVIEAKSDEDFKKAPEGGCRKRCNVRLNCGHKCERFCHVLDQKHETDKSRCLKPCQNTCELGHKCPDKCYVECRPCAVPMIKMIPKCGHSQSIPCGTKPEEFSCELPCEMTLKCGHLCKRLCGMEHTSLCLEEIQFTWPCGHIETIRCWETESKPCPQPCGTVLKCGHKCNGTCSTCFMGRVHQPCQVKTKCILNCGHNREAYCQNDPTCLELCEVSCDHTDCTKGCGELCSPCKEKCSWECLHYRCSRLCSEVCDRPRCDEPCHEMLLKCGHECIGLCGEPCPAICRKCDRKKFRSKVFGNKYRQNARFVLLEDCGHLVEFIAMDKYMLEVAKKNKIELNCCPKCQTPLRKCQRYGSIIKRIRSDIESAKKGTIGNVSLYHTLKRRVEVLTIGMSIEVNVYEGIEKGDIGTEEALTLYPCHYYKTLCKKAFVDRLKDLEKGLLTEKIILAIQKQFSFAMDIIDLRQKIMDIDTRLQTSKTTTENDYLSFLHVLLLNITKPRNILTEQEIADIRSEIQRGEAYLNYLKIRSEMQSNMRGIHCQTNSVLLDVKSLILQKGKLTREEEKEIDTGFERLNKLLKIGSRQINKNRNVKVIRTIENKSVNRKRRVEAKKVGSKRETEIGSEENMRITASKNLRGIPTSKARNLKHIRTTKTENQRSIWTTETKAVRDIRETETKNVRVVRTTEDENLRGTPTPATKTIRDMRKTETKDAGGIPTTVTKNVMNMRTPETKSVIDILKADAKNVRSTHTAECRIASVVETSEVDIVKGAEMPTNKGINCKNKCTYVCNLSADEHKCFPTQNTCCVNEIQFGFFDLAVDTLRTEIGRKDKVECSLEDTHFDEFDLLSGSDPGMKSCKEDTCACSVKDIQFGYFDSPGFE